jgi:hypothetical protein
MNDVLSRERNRVRLVDPGTGMPGNFLASEFANAAGLVILQPATLWGLERLRAEITELMAPARVVVKITDGVRTDEDLVILAARLGWKDELGPDGKPGRVSRNSQHLQGNGASGVDFRVYVGKAVYPVAQTAIVARRYFDYVEEYDDHVHVDQRDGGRSWARA